MIDVNKITSTLAKLPDAMLQKYAQLNKADPYIMALAMSESNRRKELRSAGQGAQGMQAQPKVVDKMVAEMAAVDPMGNVTGYAGGGYLPEDQGIGRLNAGNMNFAGGGIIAFADGGDVEHYYGGGSTAGTIYDPVTGVPISAENVSGNDLTFLESVGVFNPENRRALEKADRAAAQKTTALPYNKATMPAAGYTRTDPRAAAAGTFAESVKAVNTAPTADTTRRPAPGAGLGAAAAAAAPKDDPFSMSSIKKAQTEALGDSNYKIGELNNQLVDIRNRAETQVQQRLEDRKKEIEAEGDVYKDRSDRLVERGKALAGQKDQNTGLALLNAGLAIMSTPGGLMTAIGKGAQVGTAQYAAGIKDLRAAQERLDEANDRISELRMNRKDLNSREIRALEKDRDNAILDGQKMVFGFAKDIYGMDRKQAEAAFTSYMSGQEKKADIQSRERIAATSENRADARANMLPSEARTAMLLGTGTTDAERFATGMAKYKELTGDKQGTQMLKLFLEENGRREKAGQDPMSLEQFRRQSAAFFTPPAPVDTGKPTRP
jgi:hypothetical protein